jgi:hypothetical protein
LEHIRELVFFVLIIMVVDYFTVPDPLTTAGIAFSLTIVAYLVKDYFKANPYELAGVIEYMALFLWLLGSIFWNIYILHSYADQSATYDAVIIGFTIPALYSAFGIFLAGVLIQEGKKVLRSF